MSEFYFCIFCDTIVLSIDLLSDHLCQHLSEDNNESEKDLSEFERQFVAKFIDYEKALSASMALMPKELPKNSVQKLLMGCPTCDALIRCYDLIPNHDRKDICDCGQPLNEMAVYKCVQCQRLQHLDCIIKSGNGKCLDCYRKNFEISYLKCLPFEAQRDHCYQHLDYFPLVCQYKHMDEFCGQQFFTYKSCEKHLISDHKYCLKGSQDFYETISTHFDYNPIKKVDDLINTYLNSKLNVNTITNTNMNDNTKSVVPSASKGYKSSYENESTGAQSHNNSFIYDSDNDFDQSFHYLSEDIVGSSRLEKSVHTFPKSSTQSHNKKCYKEVGDSTSHLEFIPLPLLHVPKKRGRPKGSKNKTPTKEAFVSQKTLESSEEEEEEEEEVDLTHRRQYINWFTHTKVTKYPYFPQKDDEIYYLPYGHELYKQAVMKSGLYNQSNRNYTMRFFNYDYIAAKVAKIDFLFKECRKTETVIRCIYITLRPKEDKYGTIIHVKYHDMSGVLDFIILKEHYEQSIQKVWRIGENFRTIIDDNYWFGTVVGYNDADYCQNSYFKKYKIRWLSNNTIDYLSPWDLEPIDDTKSYNLQSYVPITDADRSLFFRRHRDEWPAFDEQRELKRISKGLKIIYNLDKTKEFPILQDLTDSRYREKILYPVDLKTFITRVENHFYRRHLAIKYDIKFMEANIRKLIKSVKRDPEYRIDETIAKRLKYHTKFVTALCLLFIDTHQCHNPYDLYPNIDDYLETHDVKCYSAKRVHLNAKKKFPNCLPAPHKRLPKRPQSFGDSAKTLKIFKALRNTESLSRRYSLPSVSTSSKNKNTKSKPQIIVNFKNISPNEKIIPESDDNNTPSKKNESFSEKSGNNSQDYSSDVSRSENEYQIRCVSHSSDNSEDDPDFETTNYYKRNLV